MPAEELNWYEVKNADKVDSPALLVFPGRVKHNIALVKELIGDVSRLRPHIKTHKSGEAIKLQLQAGITKFKCATIAEAELLGICTAPDVLLAYQPVGPKLERFISLTKTYPNTKYSCLIDDHASAEAISAEAIANDTVIPVYIDLNVGMNRTGIISEKALELVNGISVLKGIKLTGLHAYDGHVHDVDLETRKLKAAGIYDRVKVLQSSVKEQFNIDLKIVAGGTPTFPYYAAQADVECSPGTFIYWDAGYLPFKEQAFLPAAILMMRVISLPDETKVTLDLGHKSVAAENTIDKRIRFLNAPDLQIISQSEEHLVAEAGKGHTDRPGDVVYGIPYHVCPTVALYERAVTIENNTATGEWLTLARNRKIDI